jgi:membrane protein HdeD
MKNMIVGIIAIIVAVIMIASPVVGLATLGLISGLLILGMGVWLSILGFNERTSNDLWLFPLLVGLVGVIMGLTFLFNASWIVNLGFWAYIITGALLLVNGFIALFVGEKQTYKTYAGIFGLVFGCLFVIVGYYNINPNILGVVIGIGLLIFGILNIRE